MRGKALHVHVKGASLAGLSQGRSDELRRDAAADDGGPQRPAPLEVEGLGSIREGQPGTEGLLGLNSNWAWIRRSTSLMAQSCCWMSAGGGVVEWAMGVTNMGPI